MNAFILKFSQAELVKQELSEGEKEGERDQWRNLEK